METLLYSIHRNYSDDINAITKCMRKKLKAVHEELNSLKSIYKNFTFENR